MERLTRRRLLGALAGVAGAGAAGCAALGPDDPSGGSLRFVKKDAVPQVLGMRVTDVGARTGEEPGTVTGDTTAPPAQRTLTARASVDPGASPTYEAVFTSPVWYAVEFSVDGRTPETGTTAFTPAPTDGGPGRYLAGRVSAAGDLTWTVGSAGGPGPFGD